MGVKLKITQSSMESENLMTRRFFSVPDVYFGTNAISSLDRLNDKKVAIVTDAFMVSSGKARSLIKAMPYATVSVFGEVKPDPNTTVVIAGVQQLKSFQPDVIIALGGGSSLDAAKGIKVTLEELYQGNKIELIAIPTTSGSGSEVTSYAVISDASSGKKYPLVSSDLLPDAAILDPELVLSVPRPVAVDTGMDVLTHAIEAVVSTDANDFSDALAEKAIQLVATYLPQVVENETAIEPREHMHNASCMAGMAFNASGLGLVHGMAHALGGVLHISHGKINAMLLPLIIDFNAEAGDSDIQHKYHKCGRLMNIDVDIPSLAPKELSAAIRDLNRQFQIPSSLTELGKNRYEIENVRQTIIEATLADACTATNPRKPSESDIDKLLTKIIG
ncbi:1-propanol dehydrogenase PduQ [Vibrio sp. STUT-A11]|uniref:1-propanol dehydrogenase PduQ n=1 Tax=Vibrio sp. STUT-A11 TaxID=2976236 RepID=UPI0022B2721A|nr:1-propanol dehydrogenase PduQ [Vibrio sp. STUT-A11]BDR13775.1 alcohol dehydrogenase [Vibrio sp. STUT-A11]